MARYLCIVGRNQPLLYGYLNVVLDPYHRAGDDVEVVFDRRHQEPVEPSPHGPPDGVGERRHSEVEEEALRARGYVILPVPEAPRRGRASQIIPPALRREPRPEARSEPRPEPRFEPRPEPRLEPRLEPELEPQLDARPEPRVDPRPEVRIPLPPGFDDDEPEREPILARPLPWRGIFAVGAVVGILAVGAVVVQSLPSDFTSRLWALWPRTPSGDERVATRGERAEPSPPAPPSRAVAPAPLPAPAAPPVAATPPSPGAVPGASESPSLPPRPETSATAEPAPPTEKSRRAEALRAERDAARAEAARKAETLRAERDAARAEAARRAETLRAERDAARAERSTRAEPAPRDTARAEAPARAEVAARREPVTSRPEPATRTSSSTAVSNAQFAGIPHVEVLSEPTGARGVNYIARLRDDEGKPLAGADVTLTAVMPGGVAFSTRLGATRPGGTYAGRLSAIEGRPEALRLRVVVDGKMFEIPAIP